MKFKDTEYGNLTNKIYFDGIKLNINDEKIVSLEGSPKEVKGIFDCSNNKLETLKYCPEIINDIFDCSQNEIKNFDFFPKIINYSFYCYKNKLISLKGLPKEIKGVLNCSWNELVSLEGSPIIIYKNFYCNNNNKLISLKGNLKEIKGALDIQDNPNLKNVKQQIIKNQIKAKYYYTDEGDFTFEDIKKDFEKYKKILELNKNKEKSIIFNKDYGFGI